MILVLSADPTLQNFWTNFWNKPCIKECSAQGESILLLHPGRNPKWSKLAQKTGQYASRIIVGRGITLPKERPWKRQEFTKQKEKILLNTLRSKADETDWVGLCDPEGKLTMLAWELAQSFPRVMVWCEFKERYQSLCEALMKELGAAVELTNSREGLMGCPLIGAMEAPPFRCQWDGLLLLTGKTELPPLSGELRQELRISVPEDVKKAAPSDVDPMELYLAILKEKRQEIPPNLCFELQEDSADINTFEKFL